MPRRDWAWAYARFAIGVLLAVVAAAVLNVAWPYGRLEDVLRSAFWVLAGGALFLVVPVLLHRAVLRPAGLAALVAIPLVTVAGAAAIWLPGDAVLLRVAGAAGLVLATALAAAPSLAALQRPIGRGVAAASLALVGLPGLVLALLVLSAQDAPRLVDGCIRLALWSFLASFLLLLRARRQAAVWLAWAAVAQLAVGQGLDPWMSGPAAGRFLLAQFVIAGALLLCAAIVAFMPARREVAS